jgi:hypothetical protein
MGDVTEKMAETMAISFQKAAIGELAWEMALERLAAATGAHSAELIGFGSNFFNWITNRDPRELDEFARIGGYDPRVNSRIRIGIRAAELQILRQKSGDTILICPSPRICPACVPVFALPACGQGLLPVCHETVRSQWSSGAFARADRGQCVICIRLIRKIHPVRKAAEQRCDPSFSATSACLFGVLLRVGLRQAQAERVLRTERGPSTGSG